MIFFDEKTATFTLSGGGARYVMQVTDGVLEHRFFGSPIHADDDLSLYRGEAAASFEARVSGTVSRNQILSEAPAYGRGDFREPMFVFRGEAGETTVDLKYAGHRIVSGHELAGLPISHGGETLGITLTDPVRGVSVELFYTVFDDVPVVARSARITNTGAGKLKIVRAFSAALDLPDNGYDLITLYGAWTRERMPERIPIRHGVTSVDSKRVSSSASLNPFAALVEKSATETAGRAYGMALVYSSSWKISAEGAQNGTTRLIGGINDFAFSKTLASGESFDTPEAVLAFSPDGIGGLSRAFHDFVREHIVPPAFAKAPRPIVVNNWEATYFDFDYERLFAIIDAAEGTGIDTFVLDDGWFGARNSDRAGLGDWTVNTDKLKDGLTPLIDRCRAKGLKFGLWFEPEMVNPDSDLYRAHPDWAISCPGYEPLLSRRQLVLDITRPEVRDYLVSAVNRVLKENAIEYVKWDSNRNVTELFSATANENDRECFAHEYALGLYDLFRRIVFANPTVFFEGCSGGGSRFDLGMLCYFPQIWTSDDTDAGMRCLIQYGTSYAYPLSAMSCHVSVCPNHQNGRTTPFGTRCAVAHLGATGYELDLSKMPAEEREQIREQNGIYRRDEDLILSGDLYRVADPADGRAFGFLVVAKDRSRAIFTLVKLLNQTNDERLIPRLPGLDPAGSYLVEESGATFHGDTLAALGLPIEWAKMHDFDAAVFHFRRV
ncbi:MAG: alpha-galactosidase [Clostridia bacterium]|nr:alpha-galactosidase [Clostridia bacterium]